VPKLFLHWVVLSGSGVRQAEAAKAAALFAGDTPLELDLRDFRDGFLSHCGGQVKEFFEEMKGRIDPQLILTHWQGDAHQDHRLVAELTWNTFRNHLIFEYEIPKYDGDMGRPNAYCPLEVAVCEEKLDHLFNAFVSQTMKHWFDRRNFLGLMRIRGMEGNAPSGYAEAFHVRKAVLQASCWNQESHG
jgi:LmbE family N-acetylglucosaminyl deacetylase